VVTTHCNTIRHTSTHCNTLQHTATICNTLQYSATRCNTMSMCLCCQQSRKSESWTLIPAESHMKDMNELFQTYHQLCYIHEWVMRFPFIPCCIKSHIRAKVHFVAAKESLIFQETPILPHRYPLTSLSLWEKVFQGRYGTFRIFQQISSRRSSVRSSFWCLVVFRSVKIIHRSIYSRNTFYCSF